MVKERGRKREEGGEREEEEERGERRGEEEERGRRRDEGGESEGGRERKEERGGRERRRRGGGEKKEERGGCSPPYLGTRPTPTAVGMSPWALLLGEPVPTSGSNLTYRLWRARTLGYMKGGQSINILSTIRNLALPHQCWRRSPAPDNPYPTVQLEES